MPDEKAGKNKSKGTPVDKNCAQNDGANSERVLRDETEADESTELAEQLKPEDQKVLNTEG